MPPRKKRSNWRHPVPYEELQGGRGRRTTRAATGQTSQDTSRPRRGDKDGNAINISRSRKRPKPWVEVPRPPAPGIRFTTLTWVPVEELTAAEREKYQPLTAIKVDETSDTDDPLDVLTSEKTSNLADSAEGGSSALEESVSATEMRIESNPPTNTGGAANPDSMQIDTPVSAPVSAPASAPVSALPSTKDREAPLVPAPTTDITAAKVSFCAASNDTNAAPPPDESSSIPPAQSTTVNPSETMSAEKDEQQSMQAQATPQSKEENDESPSSTLLPPIVNSLQNPDTSTQAFGSSTTVPNETSASLPEPSTASTDGVAQETVASDIEPPAKKQRLEEASSQQE